MALSSARRSTNKSGARLFQRAPQYCETGWRLLVAADESRDLPAGAFLAEAELVAAERAQRFGRHEAGLAGRRDHLQHRVLLIAGRVVLHHTDEMQAELLDDRRVGLWAGVHLETGLGRKGP